MVRQIFFLSKSVLVMLCWEFGLVYEPVREKTNDVVSDQV